MDSRFVSEEERHGRSYAKLHSMSMGEAFKRALFDKIEEDYDITAAEEAYGEYQRSGKKAARWVSSGRNRMKYRVETSAIEKN